MSKHLTTFTSIITLLGTKCPQMKEQLTCLRTAIVQWYGQIEQQILEKNRAILAAKTRGTEKLAMLFNQFENFFINLMNNYSDPNLPLYFKIFLKIKQQFEFIDIDFDKLRNKYKTIQTQTDKQNSYMYGMDVQKLFKAYDNKQNQLEICEKNIEDCQEENRQLKCQIQQLMDRLRDMEDQHKDKVNELKQMLQKTKAQALESICQTQKKNNVTFRSTPQIKCQQTLTKKKIIADLMNHAFDDTILNPIHRENQASLENSPINVGDFQLLRMIFCQALSIERILDNEKDQEGIKQS